MFKLFITLSLFLLNPRLIQAQDFNNANINNDLEKRVKELESSGLRGFNFSGQMTMIYQTSDFEEHKNVGGTFSADFSVEKEINGGQLVFTFQYANGLGVDALAQGGAMVNNDVMEDVENHNQPYLAKAFYEKSFDNMMSGYNLTFNVGKMGVNDFFDLGLGVSDQGTQFLNQAINNNGAFDFVQDLQGHGYTYGLRLALENEILGFDFGVFSSDSYLDNIDEKYSLNYAIKWTPEWYKDRKSLYQIYYFQNKGEYGIFESDGSYISSDSNLINTQENEDNNDKHGFGISINHALPSGVDLFAKYGKQDDDRDVRHYQDMDESILVGFSIQGENWSRENDGFGVAYHVGKLTGNHKTAHELGYTGFFDRSNGIGVGNYADETVFETFYRYGLGENNSISFDYQNIRNLNYDKNSDAANFYGLRYNISY